MNEIFRHLRPLEINRRGEIISQRNGGVSFLCYQKEDSSIDFWVYVCPLNAGFSAKAAVNKLRESSKNADPWGSFQPNADPLILQLVSKVGKSELPTSVTQMLLQITKNNLAVEEKLAAMKPKSSLNIYAEN
jgi:hypothetical protein